MDNDIHIIDRRNFLLILCVLLFVFFVGFFIPYVRSKRTVGPLTSANPAEVSIIYTEQGFSPEMITITVGTTVAWTNSSGRPVWVASDPHPSHTNLEGFDQKRVLNFLHNLVTPKAEAHGSGVYEYTFTEPGIWGYHNHIYPEHRGTVRVQNDSD